MRKQAEQASERAASKQQSWYLLQLLPLGSRALASVRDELSAVSGHKPFLPQVVWSHYPSKIGQMVLLF